MIELKPCPFCGESEAKICDDSDDFDTYVVCGYCGARGEWASGQHDESRKLAARFWNQRQDVPIVDEGGE